MHEWTQKEMDALVAAAQWKARQPESRYDYAPLLKIALATGLRIGELLGLQWKDVDFGEGELHVRRQWLRTGKYGPVKTKAGNRLLPFPPDLAAFLRELKMRSKFSQPEDPIFASKTGKPLGHRNTTARGFEPIAKHADVEGVSFHDMRHAFASRMIANRISETDLVRVMGHESSDATKIYVHLFDRQQTHDRVRKAMAW